MPPPPPPPVIEFVDPHLAEDQQKKIVSKYNFFGFIDKIAIFSGGAKILPGGAAPPWPPAGYGRHTVPVFVHGTAGFAFVAWY